MMRSKRNARSENAGNRRRNTERRSIRAREWTTYRDRSSGDRLVRQNCLPLGEAARVIGGEAAGNRAHVLDEGARGHSATAQCRNVVFAGEAGLCGSAGDGDLRREVGIH